MNVVVVAVGGRRVLDEGVQAALAGAGAGAEAGVGVGVGVLLLLLLLLQLPHADVARLIPSLPPRRQPGLGLQQIGK